MKDTELTSKKIIPIISFLSALGALTSIWQTKEYYETRSGMAAFHSFCNIGQSFDCTAIEISKYSELFSGIPVSGMALAGYLVIFILSLFGLSAAHRKNLRPFLLVFSSLALLCSVVYFFIMVTLIHKFCLLCLGVDAINIALFFTVLKMPTEEKDSSGLSITHVIGTGLASLLIAFLFTKGLDPYADIKKEDINDTIENVLSAPVTTFQVPSDAPVIGNPNAPITIVKFSDYECPACRMAATAIHPLFKRYPNEVKFVFVNYPLDQACNPNIPNKMHEYACEAALVAICSSEQGKFQEAYETLFENQKDFAANKIADLVLSKLPDLDAQKLKSCITLPSSMDKIKRDVDVGGKTGLNIQSTPTFYINGKKVEGGLPTQIWIQIIDRMLTQK